MDELLCRFPDGVADVLLAVDAQQMLQDANEGQLVWRSGHLPQNGVEDIKMRVKVDTLGTLEIL